MTQNTTDYSIVATKSMDSDIYMIIVAAGSGTRFGSKLPKQFCILNGRPVLMTTIERAHLAIPTANIILVLSSDFIDFWEETCRAYHFTSPKIVIGGTSRWESVKNALCTLPTDSDGIVMVHDGARPLLNRSVAESLLQAIADGHDGAIPAVCVTDSLRRIDADHEHSQIVDRTQYYRIQTPQAFSVKKLQQAYSAEYQLIMTDDASVMELYGYTDIVMVPGDEATLKITHPHDIMLAQFMMQQCNE